MTEYYFDTETTEKNIDIAEIITIQYAKINKFEKPDSDTIVILKAWESSEKEILEKFIKETDFLEKGFSFIFVGFNLIFDIRIILKRLKFYNIIDIDFEDYIYSHPYIDLKYTCLLANNLSFRGNKLDNFIIKIVSNSEIPDLFKEKQYDKIIDYIKREYEGFVYLFQHLIELLENVRRNY